MLMNNCLSNQPDRTIMNIMPSFLSRLSHSIISRFTAILLATLTLSSLALCDNDPNAVDAGNFFDTVKAGDLGKVKAMLKDNPNLLLSTSAGMVDSNIVVNFTP